MRASWVLVLVATLALAAGCGKQEVMYGGAKSAEEGQEAEKVVVPPPSKEPALRPSTDKPQIAPPTQAKTAAAAPAQPTLRPAAGQPQPAQTGAAQAPGGPLYVLHSWKEDDSLSFLAVYYAGRMEAQDEIEAANPQVKFTGRLPAGTPVWVPAELVRPEVRKDFKLVPRTDKLDQASGTPLDRGVFHVAEGQETLAMVAAYYTGQSQNARLLAAVNPEVDPNRSLAKGQKVFIPSHMVQKDLQPKLVFVERPRPKGVTPQAASAVGKDGLGEEDLSKAEPGAGQPPVAAAPQPQPAQATPAPPAAPAKKTSAVRQPAPESEDEVGPVLTQGRHKGSAKHQR